MHGSRRSEHYIAGSKDGSFLTNPTFHLAFDYVNNLVVMRMVVEIETISGLSFRVPQYLSGEAAIGKAVPIPGGRATGTSCSLFEIPGFTNNSLVTESSEVCGTLLISDRTRV